MAGAVHFDTLQKIYIAFYQRPADPAGLRYWADRMLEAHGDSTTVVDAFAASVEARSLYGAITQDALGDVINQVYQALFQREPDTQGKDFYTAAFAQGALTVGNIVLAILQGAQADDLAAIENKLVVAREFTRQVDGRDFHDKDFGDGWEAAYAYAGQASAAMGRTMLACVTADPATVLDAAAITRILKGEAAVKEQAGGKVPSDGTCGKSIPDDSTPDGSAPDESALGDGTPGESTVDGGAPGDGVPDDGTPDDNTLDDEIRDGNTLGNGEPDGTSPSDGIPDSSTPGNDIPGDSGPDSSTPDSGIPDNGAPDKSPPGNSAPDNSTPDDGTPSGNATISFITGDDDDTILVAADGTALDGVSVWVDAGGGNDLVTVDSTGHIRMSLNAGAGDDKVVLASGIASMAARDILDGGDGFDTLVVQGGRMTQADYMVLARSVSGFEEIEFASAADVDASQLNQFESIRFFAGTSNVDVARAQTVRDAAQWALFEAEMIYPERVDALSVAATQAEEALENAKAAVTAQTSHVTGVSANQVLVARGSLNATAEKYQAATQDIATAYAAAAVPATFPAHAAANAPAGFSTYAEATAHAASTTHAGVTTHAAATPHSGNLNIVSLGAGSLIEAYAESLTLTVVALRDGGFATQLTGHVKTVDIVFDRTNEDVLLLVDKAAVVTETTEALEVFEETEEASVFIGTSINELTALSSVSIKGMGHVVINNDGSLLNIIDASGMTSASSVGPGHGSKLNGLAYHSSNSNAEIITLGAGIDRITLRESTVASMDVVEGLRLLASDDRPGELDRQNSDSLVLMLEEEKITGFRAVNVGSMPLDDVPESLVDALALLADESGRAVFHWGGDTYAFADDGNEEVDDSDVLVRLVGELDLDLLASSLNAGGFF